jgi:hypothetical protein
MLDDLANRGDFSASVEPVFRVDLANRLNGHLLDRPSRLSMIRRSTSHASNPCSAGQKCYRLASTKCRPSASLRAVTRKGIGLRARPDLLDESAIQCVRRRSVAGGAAVN